MGVVIVLVHITHYHNVITRFMAKRPYNKPTCRHIISKLYKTIHIYVSAMEEYSSYYSVVMGAPHHSQAPWPSVFQAGGGAVIPCRFEVRDLSCFTKNLMLDHLRPIQNSPLIVLTVSLHYCHVKHNFCPFPSVFLIDLF